MFRRVGFGPSGGWPEDKDKDKGHRSVTRCPLLLQFEYYADRLPVTRRRSQVRMTAPRTAMTMLMIMP